MSMSKETIIRAWKDPAFRASLSPEERAAVPESPSGRSICELEDSALEDAVGGMPSPLTANPLLCQQTGDACPITGNLCTPPQTMPLACDAI
ncbi:mersacidin/lichenicidin family type 2 lantibiotic [Archangium lansingense]|uniref:Mersacidin/lichenicidin family type 2 lantibiotic n=1 Tax=Archangium lansingense TaxID=2995310 RepID=A0ABT4A0Y6_9BACT|nr:mersacidin/lichenicidin family type 2 lantibiotic [Archangium lansinium]MCY1075295.1 mersacidin/lichenicidin family type 2 lantibiotic [Archangium lansinium]